MFSSRFLLFLCIHVSESRLLALALTMAESFNSCLYNAIWPTGSSVKLGYDIKFAQLPRC